MQEDNALAAAQAAIETPDESQVTDGTQPVTEDASADEQQPDEQPRRSRAKERIQELAADKRAAIEYAEFQKRRADELYAQLKSVQTPAEQATQPKLKDFATPEDWATAMAEWASTTATQAAAEVVRQELGQRDSQTAAQLRQAAFEESLNTAAGKHEDFWDVAHDPGAVWMNGKLLDTLQEMPDAGDLIYHLNSNPAIAREVAAMSGTRMARELGRISAKLETPAPKPTPKNVTNAPEPPTPVGGGAETDVDLTKLSTKEYIQYRRAQQAKRTRR